MKNVPMPRLCWTCVHAIDPYIDTPITEIPDEYDFVCEYSRQEVKFNATCSDDYQPCPQVQKDFNSGCHL